MLPLKQQATLADLQCYVAEMEQERGFTHNTVLQQCLGLAEEVGEVCKAVRKLDIGYQTQPHDVADELVDVLIYLSSVANRLDIDLEEAFRRKEAVNNKRVWA